MNKGNALIIALIIIPFVGLLIWIEIVNVISIINYGEPSGLSLYIKPKVEKKNSYKKDSLKNNSENTNKSSNNSSSTIKEKKVDTRDFIIDMNKYNDLHNDGTEKTVDLGKVNVDGKELQLKYVANEGNGLGDVLYIENKKISEMISLDYIAVMDNKYIVLGTSKAAGIRETKLYNSDMEEIIPLGNTLSYFSEDDSISEVFEPLDLVKDNKTLIFNVCDSNERDLYDQLFYQYKIEFNNGAYNITKLKTINNVMCNSSR